MKSSQNIPAFDPSQARGTVLIVTLWILLILSVFAVALGHRASLELKLAGYQRDELRAGELAKAAVEKALWERQRWKEENPLIDIDALNQPWSNNPDIFKDVELGDESFTGTFTVSYKVEADTADEEVILYGMEDEKSKININTASEGVLSSLLENHGVDDAPEAALSILIWRGTKPISTYPDEQAYYEAAGYECKGQAFESLPELLSVRGMTPEILYGKDEDEDGSISPEEEGIAKYLTVYTDGEININTASDDVLTALISGTFPAFDATALVENVSRYRKGDDAETATEDDNVFSLVSGALTVDVPYWNVYGGENRNKLTALQAAGKLGVSSNIYTIAACAEIEKVKKKVTATVDLIDPAKPKYLYWHIK